MEYDEKNMGRSWEDIILTSLVLLKKHNVQIPQAVTPGGIDPVSSSYNVLPTHIGQLQIMGVICQVSPLTATSLIGLLLHWMPIYNDVFHHCILWSKCSHKIFLLDQLPLTALQQICVQLCLLISKHHTDYSKATDSSSAIKICISLLLLLGRNTLLQF